MTIWAKWHKPWAPLYSLDLGESIIFVLLSDSDWVSMGDTPITVNHSLNSTFILQHSALAARWWKHELGGAGGRENVMVSVKSHPKPATWLPVTAAFVVLYSPDRNKRWCRAKERLESCGAGWVCTEKAWSGRSDSHGYVWAKSRSYFQLCTGLVSGPLCASASHHGQGWLRWLISSCSSSLATVTPAFGQLFLSEAQHFN